MCFIVFHYIFIMWKHFETKNLIFNETCGPTLCPEPLILTVSVHCLEDVGVKYECKANFTPGSQKLKLMYSDSFIVDPQRTNTSHFFLYE